MHPKVSVSSSSLLWTLVTLPAFWVAKKLSGGDWLDRGVYLYGLSFPNSAALCERLFSIAGEKGNARDDLSISVLRIMNNR